MSSPYNRIGTALPFDHVAEGLGSIHALQNWVVADMAALAALTVSSSDIGKIAKVSAPASFFILVDNTGPIWASVGQDPNAVTITVSGSPPASPDVNDIWIQIPV